MADRFKLWPILEIPQNPRRFKLWRFKVWPLQYLVRGVVKAKQTEGDLKVQGHPTEGHQIQGPPTQKTIHKRAAETSSSHTPHASPHDARAGASGATAL